MLDTIDKKIANLLRPILSNKAIEIIVDDDPALLYAVFVQCAVHRHCRPYTSLLVKHKRDRSTKLNLTTEPPISCRHCKAQGT